MTIDEAHELLGVRNSLSRNSNSSGRHSPYSTARMHRSQSSSSSSSSSSLSSASSDDIAGFRRNTWIAFSIVGGLIYGYNVSLAAPLQYIRDALALSPSHEELASASATLSDAISMLLGGFLADRFGRKPTAMFACYCSVFGCMMASLCSFNFTWLLLWRLLTGVGNGLSILLIPMYISESVETSHRGTMLTLFQLGVNAGCALPYLVMILVSEDWRACLAFGSLPALFILYQFHFTFPESSKWLRWKADTLFELEANGFKSPIQPSPPPTPSPMHEGPQARPTLELCIGILLAYVNNCVDAPLFYGPEIIAKAMTHYSRKDANVFGLCCSLLSVASVVFAGWFVINRFSRRRVYLLCLSMVVLAFWCCSLFFARFSTEDFARSPGAAATIMITIGLLNVFSTIGPSILFVVILSELFTHSTYRAKYMSVCTFAMSFFSLVINGTMLSLFHSIGTSATFGSYGTTYALCVLFFYKYLPETKQRQLA